MVGYSNLVYLVRLAIRALDLREALPFILPMISLLYPMEGVGIPSFNLDSTVVDWPLPLDAPLRGTPGEHRSTTDGLDNDPNAEGDVCAIALFTLVTTIPEVALLLLL